MRDPEQPTEKYCQDRLAFHTSGAEWYRQYREYGMARWAEEEARRWQQKLETLYPQAKNIESVSEEMK